MQAELVFVRTRRRIIEDTDDYKDVVGRAKQDAKAEFITINEYPHDCMDAGGRTNQETESRGCGNEVLVKNKLSANGRMRQHQAKADDT